MRFGINAKGMLKVPLQMLFQMNTRSEIIHAFVHKPANKRCCLKLQRVTGFACRLAMKVPMKAVEFAIAVAALGSFGLTTNAALAAKSNSAYAQKAECKREAKAKHFGVHWVKRDRWIENCIAGHGT